MTARGFGFFALQLVGFWTPDYVARKLPRYRSVHVSRLVLRIDEGRNCAEADLPPGVRVIRYRRRVDVAAVLRAIETTPYPAAGPTWKTLAATSRLGLAPSPRRRRAHTI